MRDILPPDSARWRMLHNIFANVAESAGYGEIKTPLIEDLGVFARIGDATDVVTKEMYTFADRSGDMITLRPEGTAGVVRAALQNGLLYGPMRRLWYSGPMFRYERPQKGRLREFFQWNIDIIDIEDQ